MDDSIVFYDSMESHIDDLRHILGRLLDVGFTLRGSKCLFGKSAINRLGCQYPCDGVVPTEEMSRAVAD